MRDVLLTMDECAALLVMLRCAADTTAECEALQTAARLGAEREREKAAVIAWNHYMDTCKKQGIAPASMEHWLASAAIRRGEQPDKAPDGYALVTAEGYFVGAWRDRTVAEKLQNRSSMSKGEVIRAFVFIPDPTPMKGD